MADTGTGTDPDTGRCESCGHLDGTDCGCSCCGLTPVPVAEALGLTCPTHGTPLEDTIGPYWCPQGEHHVSAWTMLAQYLGEVLDGL